MKKGTISRWVWVLMCTAATAHAQSTAGSVAGRRLPGSSARVAAAALPDAPAASAPIGYAAPAPASEQNGVAASAPEPEKVELEEDEAAPPPPKPRHESHATSMDSEDPPASRRENEESAESTPAESTKTPSRGAHFHDGFYLQIALGPGYLGASASEAGEDLSVEGGAITGSLWIGGSVTPGFVLGGGTLGAVAVNPKVTYTNANDPSSNLTTTSEATLQLQMFGLVSDFYPNPRSGLHLQAMLGYAVLSSRRNGQSTTSNSDPSGLGLMGGVGYDGWVSDDWSIGVVVRVAYAATRYDDAGSSLSLPTIAPGLLATFTYN